MATSAWLRGPSAMRLTEGLVSVLKEQRPDYIPVLLSGYREHGVFHTQVYPDLKMPISSGASYLCAPVLQAPSLPRVMLGTLEQEHFGYKADGVILRHICFFFHCFVVIFLGCKRRGRSRWLQQCQTWLKQDQVTKNKQLFWSLFCQLATYSQKYYWRLRVMNLLPCPKIYKAFHYWILSQWTSPQRWNLTG